jgi:hypothetical protein
MGRIRTVQPARNLAPAFAVTISFGRAGFLLWLGSLIVLARLLDPKDFGLVGMVFARVRRETGKE